MRITALDLRRAEFGNRFRGYDPLEVQQLLQLAAGEIESLVRENLALRNDLQDALNKLTEMREKEVLLRETLMEAQRTRQQTRESAQKEAELVIADAEVRARQLVQDAHIRLTEVQRQIHDLRVEKERMRTHMTSSVDAMRMMLEADEQRDRQLDPTEGRLHFFEIPKRKETAGHSDEGQGSSGMGGASGALG